MPVPLTLKVYKGDELIASKDYDRDIIKIGRLSSAHLCLEDEKVSRIHSVIEVGADGALSIIDMGSVEGTYVNGKRVNKGTLQFGDEVKVGNTTIKVESAAAQAAAPSAPPALADEPEEATRVVKGQSDESDEELEEEEAPPPPPPAATKPAASAKKKQAASKPVSAPRTQMMEMASRTDPGMDDATTDGEPMAAAAARNKGSGGAGPSRSRPERRKGGGVMGLELRFMWGDQMVANHFIRPGKPDAFTVGTAEGVDFAMGESKLPTPKFEVVKSDGHSFQLRFGGKMKGGLERKGQERDLQEVIESGKASNDGDAYSLTIDGEDFAWVDLGNVTLEVFQQPVPKPVFAPLIESIDFTALNIFLVMFFLGSLFVITALNRDLEGDAFADDLSNNQARIAKLIIKPPDIQQRNKFLDALQKKKDAGEMAAKHKGSEGQMGKKDAPKTNKRTQPKGDPNHKDEARNMMSKIFGGGQSGGISTVFGKNGLGGGLQQALGGMFGSAPGDSQGMGGLGLRGSGGGGGGVGNTIGIGGIGTKGRGGGTGNYGSGVGTLGGKKSVDIGITSSDPVVMGSLDKELIRQVIRRNAGQIRYCYESQLTRYPNLNGKVTVNFVISGSGSVASSKVKDSTVGNAELETCIAGRVRTWVFPKPKGGGVVIVNYPFLLKQSGG